MTLAKSLQAQFFQEQKDQRREEYFSGAVASLLEKRQLTSGLADLTTRFEIRTLHWVAPHRG
jgi:hypothetical protein